MKMYIMIFLFLTDTRIVMVEETVAKTSVALHVVSEEVVTLVTAGAMMSERPVTFLPAVTPHARRHHHHHYHHPHRHHQNCRHYLRLYHHCGHFNRQTLG
jgi:hypothetical protein